MTATVTVLTVTDLFTPAASGIGASGVVPLTPPAGSWFARQIQSATTIGMPTTSWHSGDVELELLAINAIALSQDDAWISLYAQSAFLSTAASGSVTYQALNGQLITTYVTPDPSIPSQNPTGALGFLDLTMQGVYGISRVLATYAVGPLAIANLGATTIGPYTAGTYHASNALEGSTYSNTGTFSVPPSTIAGNGGQIATLSVGLTSTSFTTQAPHGLTVGASVYIALPAAASVLFNGALTTFALVTDVPSSNAATVAVGSNGAFNGGGNVYLCTTANMQADVIGVPGNSGPGAVTNAITSSPNVLISNIVPWNGTNYESNASAASRAVLSLAAASPNGPSQAYEYFALSAQSLLAGTYTFSNGGIVAAKTISSPATGIVITTIASSTPASTALGQNVTPGCAQNAISGMTNANPAVVTCANGIGLASGGTMGVILSGVLGTLGGAANGSWIGTYVSANSFSIPLNTTALSAFSTSGQVEGGDLGAVDNLLQDNVVPDGITSIAQSALALPIAIAATVTVPAVNVATYKIAAPAAITTYLTNNPELPIGGIVSSVLAPVPVSFDQIVAALINAGILAPGQASYVIGTPTVTVNGGTIDVPFPTSQYQAVLASFTLTVVGV